MSTTIPHTIGINWAVISIAIVVTSCRASRKLDATGKFDARRIALALCAVWMMRRRKLSVAARQRFPWFRGAAALLTVVSRCGNLAG
jgi:hypothetical protein